MLANYELLEDAASSATFKEALALDVLIGLTETTKRIPSKHFYDVEGSRLFQAIMDLPEYYLTRAEFEILQDNRGQIADSLHGQPFNLVELGPGDATKTRILLRHFTNSRLHFQYVPIDISESAMSELIRSLNSEFPELQIHGLVSDYLNAVSRLKGMSSKRNMVVFLGSNIGNLNRSGARVFLRSLWNSLQHDDLLLIGFDLKKDIDLLLKAYNDSQGVTAEFNLNLLRRINRELGANFDLNRFRHYATYNVFSGAMESYLVSLERQTVYVKEIGQSFTFEPWEPIHTEYSYKYLESDIRKLAEETGFVPEIQLYDSRCYFTDCIWRVQKENGHS
jgi:L-histidine Nalpha-methyltransferase